MPPRRWIAICAAAIVSAVAGFLAAPAPAENVIVRDAVAPVEPQPVTPAPTALPDGPEPFVEDLPQDAIELAAVGDVNLGGRVGDLIAEHGPSYPWTGVRGALRAADLAIVNLECAISRRGTPADKEFTFRGSPEAARAMGDAGVDVASLANNHAADFGREALLDTVRHVADAGVSPVGAGTDEDAAWRPVFLERRGVRFAFVAATRVLPYHFRAGSDLPGVASAYDEGRLVDAVRAAEARADVVVVLIHWGTELAPTPDGVQRGLARTLARAGADIVLGHHPHVLQPVERVEGTLVAFSLGNFIFTSPTATANETMILRVGVRPDRSLVAARIPVSIVSGRPVPTS